MGNCVCTCAVNGGQTQIKRYLFLLKGLKCKLKHGVIRTIPGKSVKMRSKTVKVFLTVMAGLAGLIEMNGDLPAVHACSLACLIHSCIDVWPLKLDRGDPGHPNL